MRQLGVDKVFVDKCSGKNTNRPQFAEMMATLRAGDTVVVESYSRMSRSTKDLLDTVEKLNNMGVYFVSKKENVDTSTPTGRLILTLIAGINQFEREVMLERQREGIDAMPVVDGQRVSVKTGRGFGRPQKSPDNFADLYAMQQSGEITLREAMALAGVGRTKWYEMARMS